MCVLVFPGISGYVSANMYKKMGGDKWVWNINLTSALFASKLLCLYICNRALLQYFFAIVVEIICTKEMGGDKWVSNINYISSLC